MKIKCKFCDSWISDTDETCPNCGAVNDACVRGAKEAPKTIEELKQWYTKHNLPPEETTRFFIGKNYQGAKAFGIYEENGKYIVYKNKADGTRAIRYQGKDEAYAVNELYQKLKSEIQNQKSNSGKSGKPKSKKKKIIESIELYGCMLLVIAGIIFGSVYTVKNSTARGYYSYQDTTYYYLDNSWYYYDAYTSDWSTTSVDSELSEHAEDYYESSDYDSSYNVSDFQNTSYYQDWESSNWDNDSDWDSSDSWDSDSTDWGSDW